jgi:hypothetical protein
VKIKKRQQSAKKLSGCIATTKKAYICGVALAADNKNVERRNALTRRNLVNFNDRGAVGQAFHPIRAWTAFIDSSIRFTRAFLAEYKSQAALFCALAKSDRGSRKTDRVGKKNEIKNHGRRR